jgi:hypothetical protein
VFEPLRAIDALNDHDVDYVVIGGWATLQHGATRLTQDIDICPDLAPENLERLGQALTALHAELHIADGQTVPVPLIDSRLLAQMQIGNWSTDAGRVDVLHEIPTRDGSGADYGRLRTAGTTITDSGRTFTVAGLADIAASKRAVGRPKDLAALPELEQLLAGASPAPDGPVQQATNDANPEVLPRRPVPAPRYPDADPRKGRSSRQHGNGR